MSVQIQLKGTKQCSKRYNTSCQKATFSQFLKKLSCFLMPFDIDDIGN